MSRIFTLMLVFTSMIMATSCSTTKKGPEDTTAVGDVSNDPNVSSDTMSFDQEGSDSGKIQGLATVHFDYDKSALTSEARTELSSNANWIKENSQYVIQIEGHCDSRGSQEYNIALGERRAIAVKNFLVGKGVDPKRLSVTSYGKEKLIALGDTEADHAANRRANFKPLSK